MITLYFERFKHLLIQGIPPQWGLAVVLCLLPACIPTTIQGAVEDLEGNRLPGVVVEVDGHQALTNTRGEYEVRYEPGEVNVRFMKTGYTGGHLKMAIDEPRPVQARTVTLWPLPRQKGVHFFEDYRYRSTGALEPQRFDSDNLGTVYGTEHWTEVQVGPEPRIIAHRLPRDGLRVYRMEMVELFVEDDWGESQITEGYIGTREVPHKAQYIDDAESLLAIEFPEGIPPGNYAVSWGALQGETNIDSRIWIFGILPSEPEPEVEEDGEENGEEDNAESNADGEG